MPFPYRDVTYQIQDLAEKQGYLVETLDWYVILFVCKAGRVESIKDKAGMLAGIHIYDQHDYLDRFDTAGEIFIDLGLLEPEQIRPE